jgi:cell division protein FtsX
MAIEATYAIELRDPQAAGELVKALNRIEGVQSVSLNRETAEG